MALTAQDVREKISRALLAASGTPIDTMEQARAFTAQLPFSDGNTFGGNSSCVELLVFASFFLLLGALACCRFCVIY
jgi:hypothetical protein